MSAPDRIGRGGIGDVGLPGERRVHGKAEHDAETGGKAPFDVFKHLVGFGADRIEAGIVDGLVISSRRHLDGPDSIGLGKGQIQSETDKNAAGDSVYGANP